MELMVNVHLPVDSGDWTQVTRFAQQGPFPMQVVWRRETLNELQGSTHLEVGLVVGRGRGQPEGRKMGAGVGVGQAPCQPFTFPVSQELP